MATSLYINLTNGVDTVSILCPAQSREALPPVTSIAVHDCNGSQDSLFTGECTLC